MSIDESQLKPFDLEAANRGEAVVAKIGDEYFPVISACWQYDSSWVIPVMLQPSPSVCSYWTVRSKDALRMAPKTRPMWYGLMAFREGGIGSFMQSSEEDVRRLEVENGVRILVIHSLEMPE